MEKEIKKQQLKGGILIIGSLFWENEQNCVEGQQNKGKIRREWRERNLDMVKTKEIKMPTRYGRISGKRTRKNTYTMLLSKDYNNEQFIGSGQAVPFSKEIKEYVDFKAQAVELAIAEGICTKEEEIKKLGADFSSVAIWVNEHSVYKNKIDQWWREVLEDKAVRYDMKADSYAWRDGTLLTQDFRLNLVLPDCDLDFAFCTYMKPKHAVSEMNSQPNWDYPTPQEIAKVMMDNDYQTYFRSNIQSNIHTSDDNQIISFLKVKDELHSVK